MASLVYTSLPWALSGATYDGNSGTDLRNSTVSAMFYDPGPSGSGSVIGVRGGVIGGSGLLVSAAGGMEVTVAQGHFVVPNTSTPAAGAYVSTLSSAATLTLAAADPTNPRIDIVVAFVDDTGTSGSYGAVAVITGTPGASPALPGTYQNSIVLAEIAVAANAVSVSSGNITGTRSFTTAAGGILVAAKNTVNGYVGQLAYDGSSGSFYHNTNLGGGASSLAKQMRVLPFAPVTAALSGGNYSLTGSETQIPGLSATVTCDGQTDFKITYHIAGFTGYSSSSLTVTVNAYIDGAMVDQVLTAKITSGDAQAGIHAEAYTGSSSGFFATPAAGSHTVTIQAFASATSGSAPQVHAFSGVPASAWMRVEPVAL